MAEGDSGPNAPCLARLKAAEPLFKPRVWNFPDASSLSFFFSSFFLSPLEELELPPGILQTMT